MILFSILVLMTLLLMVVTVVALSVGGAAFIVIFGDVIICVFILMWIIKRLWKRRK